MLARRHAPHPHKGSAGPIAAVQALAASLATHNTATSPQWPPVLALTRAHAGTGAGGRTQPTLAVCALSRAAQLAQAVVPARPTGRPCLAAPLGELAHRLARAAAQLATGGPAVHRAQVVTMGGRVPSRRWELKRAPLTSHARLPDHPRARTCRQSTHKQALTEHRKLLAPRLLEPGGRKGIRALRDHRACNGCWCWRIDTGTPHSHGVSKPTLFRVRGHCRSWLHRGAPLQRLCM